MIKFNKVKWKNFLSTGNTFTEIDLNRNKSTLIVGPNGCGKSTMLDAVSFGLFGKPHRSINKQQLVNSINGKECIVEVNFSIGQSVYNVIRGIKPNTFEIWRDGTMINQSSHAKEYQKILEQNILKLNHKSFHQVVVLGSSSFIPFMQLSTGHRRGVIEDLLDINVFSKMNIILREQTNKLKDELKDLNYKIDISTNKIDTQKKYIKDIQLLTDENKKQYHDKITISNSKITVLQKDNYELSDGLDDEQTKIEGDLKELHDLKNVNMMANSEVQTQMRAIGKTAKFFETTDNCPTCKQSISSDIKEIALSEARTEAKSLQSRLTLINDEYKGLVQDIDNWNKLLGSVREKTTIINMNNKEIASLQNSIKEYQEFLNNDVSADLSEAKNQLENLIMSKSDLYTQKMERNEKYSYNSAMAEMLKDTGIKTKIIKQYLPVMNTLINQYLQVLDFYVHFDLDDEFNETIRSRHRDDFTYESFSEGEKQRIDLSLLFTWRQIAKMKNSVSTNLLILDETFDSSLDHEGVENLLKILTTLPDETNVFVISHKGEILDNKFEDKIEFTKVKNFSKIAA
tara:strand:+ start:12444 stop:14156 length:1713 start_codon:yes stop_codon:yes gene_type:complete